FSDLGDHGLCPPWLKVDQHFADAAKNGRDRAFSMLNARRCLPLIHKFCVRVGLPDLRMLAEGALTYKQGSIALPVALALLCKHPQICKSAILNPTVIPTGPVTRDSVQPKMDALDSVGGARSL